MHGDILEQLTRFYLGHITNDGRSETENRIKIDLAKNIFNINKYVYNKDFAHNILSCKIGLFTETIPEMPIGRSAKKNIVNNASPQTDKPLKYFRPQM